ncbi:hypothetical protein FVE85_0039 [Porphyridium purpureum]|uniref:Uncharacterized protein n=1 Tax=Porphyridium purpureum TaxID=35688 RepID=A0A5J4YZ98_PORPP|nr:hypothetical protein FVE85_0039 [Porphyridium purpureum]|eukprot:POR8591..scf208_2
MLRDPGQSAGHLLHLCLTQKLTGDEECAMWQWLLTCCGLCDPASDPGAVSNGNGVSHSQSGTGNANSNGKYMYALDPGHVDFDIEMSKRALDSHCGGDAKHAQKRSKVLLGKSFVVLEREFKNRGYDDTAIASMRSVFSWICDSASETSLQLSLYPDSEDKITNIEDDPEYQEWMSQLADINDTKMLFFDEEEEEQRQRKNEKPRQQQPSERQPPAMPSSTLPGHAQVSPQEAGQGSENQPKHSSSERNRQMEQRTAVEALTLERPESPRSGERIAPELYARADEQQAAMRESREHENQVAIAERIVNHKQERTLSQPENETSPDGAAYIVMRQDHESETAGELAYAPSSVDTL